MLLSIAMIAEALSDYVIKEEFHETDQFLTLARFRFYDGGSYLYADTLYVMSAEIAESLSWQSLKKEENIACIITGDPSEIRIPDTVAALYISEKLRAEKLSNILWDTFERYRRIEEDMQASIREHAPLQKLVELATPLFGNELTVRDRDYRYIAHSYKTLRFNRNYPTDEDGYTSPDELFSLKRNPAYVESDPKEEPWQYDYYGQNMWCQDIFVKNNFLYRIKLIDVNHPFRPYDKALLHYFVQCVKEHPLASAEGFTETALFPVFEPLLRNSRDAMDPELERVLKELKWKENDRYVAACLVAGDDTERITAYSYYCGYLNRYFPRAVTLLFDGTPVIIANLSGENDAADHFHDALTTFLREENFRCGLSVAGGSLLKMHALYLQAKFALEQGARLNPSVWLYRFRDYRMQYLKQKISEDFSPEEFLVPGLSLLAQYDEENNTDYMNTLRVYLMEDRNISQAAQKLSMHRSTLMYRLKKIREITGENPDLAEVKVLLAFLMI